MAGDAGRSGRLSAVRVDLPLQLLAFHPPLDNLDPVEVATNRVFECHNEKGRRGPGGCAHEITAHRHTLLAADHAELEGVHAQLLCELQAE